MIRIAHAIMKFLAAGVAVSGLVLAMGAVPAAGAAQQAAGVRAAPGAAGTWGTAIEVPGLAALNVRGAAEVDSVSCKSAGNCSAGGFYTDDSGRTQGFVVSQSHGLWGTAIEVPGLAALNATGTAEVLSVSCGSPGNCLAGGFYGDASGRDQGFVVSQSNGLWGTAIEVPGLAPLNTGVQAQVNSVSCASAGNCSAGGFYTDSSGDTPGFVVSQANGHWGKAIEVPGLGALNGGLSASVRSVSCASAGNCSAVGTYTDSSNHFHTQGFVVSQSSGRWGKAIEVPGLGALNIGGTAAVNAVSCASAGSCSAGGTYLTNTGGYLQGFVVSQSSGRWGKAIEVPGLGALNVGQVVKVDSVSCGSAGTAPSAASIPTVPAFARGSWSARAAGTGARPSRCPAWPR